MESPGYGLDCPPTQGPWKRGVEGKLLRLAMEASVDLAVRRSGLTTPSKRWLVDLSYRKVVAKQPLQRPPRPGMTWASREASQAMPPQYIESTRCCGVISLK